jgi:NAD(P)-dependent dehydrogenase (short-subunit alcohol dehydrogenase family)
MFIHKEINKMNIIINGGSHGIGKELTLYLSKDQGNEIIVTGRDTKALEMVASASPNIHPFTADLSDQKTLSFKYLEAVRSHFQHIDILINMAGALIAKDFLETSESEARMMMETNFLGPASVIRTLQPLMQKGSHIVNISSMGGYQGSVKFRGLAYYSASKSAIACLSECLAEEFRELGISVNCVALGAVQTEMLSKAFPGYQAPVNAEDIAPFLAYIALNGHKYMNGKIIPLAMSNP